MYFLLKNCRVLEPGTDEWKSLDIGIKDGRVVTKDDEGGARPDKVVDIGGKFVSPAWVDLHTHVYKLGTSLGVDADAIGKRSGVGVFVDAGSAGAGNFAGFREHVIKQSRVKIYSLLNIGFGGIPFFGIQKTSQASEIARIQVADEDACIDCIRKNRDTIVGIKVRLSGMANGELGVAPLKIAKKCAKAVGVPVMLHFGKPPPDLLELIGLLGPGDILTHSLRSEPNSILERDGSGHVLKAVKAAQRRGVTIDVGHGSGSFSFDVAEAALRDGFAPDSISTDIHILSVPEPVHDLPTTMSKLLNFGMRLEDVVNAVTYNPARAIRRPKHGSIIGGNAADLVAFEVIDAKRTVKDSTGAKRTISKFIRPTLRIQGGEVTRLRWSPPG
jgi:dihydroorotase